MASFRLGHNAIRQLNPSTNALLQRVELVARVLASSHSTTLPNKYRSSNSFQLITRREITDRAAEKLLRDHGVLDRTTSEKATKKTAVAKPKTKTKTKTKAKKTVQKAKKTVKKTQKSKKKPVAKKPKVKRVKKVLTPEEQQKIRVKDLKIKALSLPHALPSSAWSALNTEVMRETNNLASGVKEASVKYKTLVPEERERYNRIANENKAKNDAAYEAWVQSFTPDQIRIANNARAQLRRITRQPRKWPNIKDDRQVKRPAPARLLFNKARWASGDFNGMKVIEVPQLISKEWQDLPASQKKIYEDQAAKSREFYASERTRVYGENVRPGRRRATRTVSSAASPEVQRQAAAASG